MYAFILYHTTWLLVYYIASFPLVFDIPSTVFIPFSVKELSKSLSVEILNNIMHYTIRILITDT